MRTTGVQRVRATLVACVVALVVAAGALPAAAADLDAKRTGFTCPDNEWMHLTFVSNQVPKGSSAGSIEVVISPVSSGPEIKTTEPMQVVGQKVRTVEVGLFLAGLGPYMLISASTDLPGKLILTDAYCAD